MATNGTAPTTGDLLTVASGVSRLHYFYGQLLTQRDLDAEQRYHVGLRRLMQREAFGTGTVAGLRVEAVGASNPASVYVRAGLAMDPDGRELLLANEVCVTIADAPQRSTNPLPTPPAGGWTAADIAAWLAGIWGASIGADDIYNFTNADPASLFPRLLHAGLTELSPDVTPAPGPQANSFPTLVAELAQLTKPPTFALGPGQLLRDHLFHALVGTTYLGLRYAERGTEPAPAVLDASCCGGDASCFPSRREEGVTIVAQSHTFPTLRDPYSEATASLAKQFIAQENPPPPSPPPPPGPSLIVQPDSHRALCDYLLHAWRGFPPDGPCSPGTLPVVPIARAYWSRFARAAGLSRVLSVNNCSRPFAPGVPPVRALYDLLTKDTGAQPSPRIETITPADHGPLPSSLTVTARATGPLAVAAGFAAVAWEVYFYPAGSTSTPMKLNNATPSGTASGTTITVNVQISTASPDTIVLTFTSSSGNMPSGAYLWRIDLDQQVVAQTTTVPLDSTPNPPHAVPSGGHATIVPFEAVFYVP